MSYSSKFLTKQKQIQVWQLQYLSGIYEYMPNDAVQSSMSEQIRITNPLYGDDITGIGNPMVIETQLKIKSY